MKSWVKGAAVLSTALAITTAVGTVPAFASNSQVVHLTYWHMWTGVYAQKIQSMVNDFNKTHPDIQVTAVPLAGNNVEQKLLTAIAAGDPPDVFTEWSPYVAAFAQQHALVNLSQFMVGKYAGLKNFFYPSAAAWGEYQGKMYAMPWTMNSFMLYYNTDIMKAAGLNPNKPPKTIQELDADQAKEWKISNGNVEQIGFYPNWYDIWMSSFGVNPNNIFKNNKYNMLDPHALNLLNWIASYKKYPFTQVNSFINAVSGSSGASDPFVMGKEGFTVSGMWEQQHIAQYNPGLHYSVTYLPVAPGGYAQSTWVNGNYNEIPAGSNHKKEAFEFIAWLSGYQNTSWAAKSERIGDWIPDSPQITNNPVFQSFLNEAPNRRPFLSIMMSPHDTVTPVTPVDMMYELKLQDAVNYVLQGQKNSKQAFSDLQQTLNQELTRTK